MYLERILKAKVYDVAVETPLEQAPRLSARLNNAVWLKREDMQPVFSFKLRGAYNKLAHLSEAERARGVIAASAGNHAQGVALSAQKLGCRAVIVMPETTPEIKVSAVRALGAEVVLIGDAYADAQVEAERIAAAEGLTPIHPFDDPDVIAGQGTIGMEILRQAHDPIDAIFIAVGGGGMLAGVASYVKALYPEVEIFGVEPSDSAAMHEALKAGHPVDLERVGLFADGVAVKRVGDLTFAACKDTVREVILVDTDEICAAIKDVFEDTRSILEPAGALSVAGMKKWVEREGVSGKNLVAIACGANMNFDRLRFVAERSELGEHREAILAVTLPEQCGAFKAFCRFLGARNITEFNYRYADAQAAHVFVGIGVRDRAEAMQLVSELNEAGYQAVDLTDNEMAKLHLRYMVGGHAPQIANEVVYRFIFPERPGALMTFLDSLSEDWLITLFHYRNHGSDAGRVLVALDVPVTDRAAFQASIDALGYQYHDETGNIAYQLFLGAQL
ncbi:MAG: threonine dehydratase [Kiritimatiellia bacterium]|jgi:threonine dehydratase